VLEAYGEDGVAKPDDQGSVLRADLAGGAHAGGADMREIVDRCPHELN